MIRATKKYHELFVKIPELFKKIPELFVKIPEIFSERCASKLLEMRIRTSRDAHQSFRRCLPKRLMLPKIGFYHPENKDKTPS